MAEFVTPYAEMLEAICSLIKLSQRRVRGTRRFCDLISFYNAPCFRARNIRFYDAVAKTIFSTLIERWLASQSSTVKFSNGGWTFAGGYFGLAPKSTQGQLGVAFERAGVQLGIQLEGTEFRPFVVGTAVTDGIRDNWLKRAVSFSPSCSVGPAPKLRGKSEYGYGSSFRFWKLSVPRQVTFDEVLNGISGSMDYLKQEILRRAPWLP